MSNLLDSSAVGCLTGGEAQEALDAYIRTRPYMAQNHTVEAAPSQTPAAGAEVLSPQ